MIWLMIDIYIIMCHCLALPRSPPMYLYDMNDSEAKV